MCAPTARKAASKPPSRIASSTLSTLLSSWSSTPMSMIRATSASSTSRGSRYLGMPKRIMPPAHRAGVADRDRVAEPGEVVGGRQPRGPGAHHQHALARALRRGLDGPALLDRLVAEEALDRVDAHGLVELAAVAGRLARVVADPPHDRGERVVLHQHAPGGLVVALLRVVEPALDVLAGRAGVVARRQPAQVVGALGAPRAGLVGQAGADVERDGEGLVHHSSSRSGARRARRSTSSSGRRRSSGPAFEGPWVVSSDSLEAPVSSAAIRAD